VYGINAYTATEKIDENSDGWYVCNPLNNCIVSTGPPDVTGWYNYSYNSMQL